MRCVVKCNSLKLGSLGGLKQAFACINDLRDSPDEKERLEGDDVAGRDYCSEQELEELCREARTAETNKRHSSQIPRLFLSDGGEHLTALAVKGAIMRLLRNGAVLHRIVLSPADDRVDIDRYVQTVMRNLGLVKGQDLMYVYVVHNNAEYRQAHVVLLGRDRDYADVTLSRFDLMCLRRFGDRLIARELASTKLDDRDIENWLARQNLA